MTTDGVLRDLPAQYPTLTAWTDAAIGDDHKAALFEDRRREERAAYDRADSAATARAVLEKREPGRAAKIAAVHMLAGYLAEHPELPAPYIVDVWGPQLTEHDEPDEAKRVGVLLDWAAANGATVFEASTGIIATVLIGDRAAQGVQIKYMRAVNFDDRPAKRYTA